jgi:hypothetical protein
MTYDYRIGPNIKCSLVSDILTSNMATSDNSFTDSIDLSNAWQWQPRSIKILCIIGGIRDHEMTALLKYKMGTKRQTI